MPNSSSSASPSPPPARDSPAPPVQNSLKRKDRPEDEVVDDHHTDGSKPVPSTRPDEYEKGFIVCETCGLEVSIRDDKDNFTTKHWDAHRMTHSPAQSATRPDKPVAFAPEGASHSIANPPAKRRRAKRTEEERIEYLRADPYVGQFEAYRVLCASCDKWIRLRPNSTYCSIPWDAHRKSCLAKKINNKNVYALEERNNLFSKDPDVRKFDPERLLCNMCDQWLSLPPDDHLQAVQKWVQHRDVCQKTASSSSSQSKPHRDQQTTEAHQGSPYAGSSPSPTPKAPVQSQSPQPAHPRLPPIASTGAPPPSSFHALTPSTYTPTHESRRRSAEQRAANLRQDPYIAEVEPSRVLCKLCQKWVQLRQDSTYCAYPWNQHRTKCEARHFRRNQKPVEVVDPKGRRYPPASYPLEEDELYSDHEGAGPPPRSHHVRRRSEDPESEDGVDPRHNDNRFYEHRPRHDQRPYPPPRMNYPPHHSINHGHGHHQYPPPSSHYKPRAGHASHGHSSSSSRYPSNGIAHPMSSSVYRHERRGSFQTGPHLDPPFQPRPQGHRRQSVDADMDVDADGEADADGDEEGDEMQDNDARNSRSVAPPPPPPFSSARGIPSSRAPVVPSRNITRRPWPVGLADLDSHIGRKQFIFASVEYLFSTTYESTDDMSISSLLAYLNAAMPQDKHEDFDTTEVVRAVASLKEQGKVIFEGDIVRSID